MTPQDLLLTLSKGATISWEADAKLPFNHRSLHYFKVCDSTNTQTKTLLLKNSHPLPLVVAEQQTAGRGRMGRTWQAQAHQNLLFSMAMKPNLPIDRMASAVLVWAAAMAAAMDLWVKWPNDLVDNQDRKVGGILSELVEAKTPVNEHGPSKSQHFVVLGIGINVNQTQFAALPNATSLRTISGHTVCRATVLSQLVAAIDQCSLDAPDTLAQWRSRNRTIGRRVRIGQKEGMVTGIRADGALLLDDEPVLAGDVELISS